MVPKIITQGVLLKWRDTEGHWHGYKFNQRTDKVLALSDVDLPVVLYSRGRKLMVEYGAEYHEFKDTELAKALAEFNQCVAHAMLCADV